ncbi:MAG: c-type cytochrome biogenesis protein CcsB [Alphaproteobacteria bacterium]|nr:MAG: c-type cytochrome biogenesis protein CcsB [Alphaproteobacteria bacterium]
MSHIQRIWLVLTVQTTMLALSTLGLLVLLQPNLSPHTNPALLLSTLTIPGLAVLVIMATFAAFLKKPMASRLAGHILLAATGLAAGLALTIPYETSQVLASGHWGMSNLYEVSVLTIAIIGFLALGFNATTGQGRILPFITPILSVAALFTWWLTTIGAATPSELVPALQNSILPFHVFANFVGYGCFAIGAAAGAAILIRHYMPQTENRIPKTEVLEKLAYQSIVIGFPVFSIAILLGCVWAYQAWGGYWSWDPKETWALIVWLLYAAYLHARAQLRTRPTVLAWWLLAGFAATLFCYIGVNMFLSGLHSYGSLAS